MLNGIPLEHFMIISAILFSAGLFSVLSRKNAIMILIGIELMINAGILNLVVFGAFDKQKNEGQVFALFAIVLAAAGVAVALAIILNVYRQFKTVEPNQVEEMKY
ncbi:NADH-quinone oxidoreductase subunit NuoK [Solitalea sp. MAHUQ-68]|uniref:NADH-quinone oxidoreductase subunit K n=1 Tax=Solitalea agri TaxID=2953739 RepID=A0A9X2F7W9_9SPHI|nr:NADH-quinone oxidoreductase subunit NuoK [Solitalea agri]MCO4293986.1 NADH-quinone oxidoreductase subunit NuoK [Solitalea agri]